MTYESFSAIGFLGTFIDFPSKQGNFCHRRTRFCWVIRQSQKEPMEDEFVLFACTKNIRHILGPAIGILPSLNTEDETAAHLDPFCTCNFGQQNYWDKVQFALLGPLISCPHHRPLSQFGLNQAPFNHLNIWLGMKGGFLKTMFLPRYFMKFENTWRYVLENHPNHPYPRSNYLAFLPKQAMFGRSIKRYLRCCRGRIAAFYAYMQIPLLEMRNNRTLRFLPLSQDCILWCNLNVTNCCKKSFGAVSKAQSPVNSSVLFDGTPRNRFRVNSFDSTWAH